MEKKDKLTTVPIKGKDGNVEKKKVGSGMKDNTTVSIKAKAYIKMKKHVLRFASNAKDASEFREVMGMLMGKLVDGKNPNIKNVIVEDAVPVNHGGAVEVAFAPEDYVNFSILDSQYAEKGLFNVGWYHSHPGLTCFFSSVDIRNQLGFQAANPSAIGIVFDHTRFKDKDDLGFDVYRLDNPGQGPMSDYHDINWSVDTPDDISFYHQGIKELIDAYHKGEPAILELSEVPDVFGDMTVPGRNSMMAKEPELNFVAISEKLTKSLTEMTGAFLQPVVKFLNEWAGSISKGLIDKNIHLLEVVVELKTNLSKSIGGLQSWFKFQINDKLRNIDILIDDQLENLGNQRKDLLDKIDGIEASIKEKLAEAFAKALGQTLTKITQDITNTLTKFKIIMESSSALTEKSTAQRTLMTQGIQEYTQQTDSLKKSTESLSSSLEMTLNTSIGVLGKDIEQLVEKQKDMIDSLKAIKNIANSLK